MNKELDRARQLQIVNAFGVMMSHLVAAWQNKQLISDTWTGKAVQKRVSNHQKLAITGFRSTLGPMFSHAE